MTGIEIALLLIGCVFMAGSFFVSEKLSGTEINRIAELSDNELKRIIGKGIENAESRIDVVIEDKVEEVSDKVEIALERESNMKIMAINEYSDTVMDSMKKAHDEIMFLYSMLNDKHTEMTSLTSDLQRLAANIRNMQENEQKLSEKRKAAKSTERMNENYLEKAVTAKEEAAKEVYENAVSKTVTSWKETSKEGTAKGVTSKIARETEVQGEAVNHNDMILALHKEGFSKVEIARKLNLGVGEVSLVIGLYKGE